MPTYTVETDGNGRYLLSRGAAAALEDAITNHNREAYEHARAILRQLGYIVSPYEMVVS